MFIENEVKLNRNYETNLKLFLSDLPNLSFSIYFIKDIKLYFLS